MKKLYLCSGEMAEWSIAAVLKTVVQQCTGGSNPSFSAEEKGSEENRFLFLFENANTTKLWVKTIQQ